MGFWARCGGRQSVCRPRRVARAGVGRGWRPKRTPPCGCPQPAPQGGAVGGDRCARLWAELVERGRDGSGGAQSKTGWRGSKRGVSQPPNHARHRCCHRLPLPACRRCLAGRSFEEGWRGGGRGAARAHPELKNAASFLQAAAAPWRRSAASSAQDGPPTRGGAGNERWERTSEFGGHGEGAATTVFKGIVFRSQNAQGHVAPRGQAPVNTGEPAGCRWPPGEVTGPPATVRLRAAATVCGATIEKRGQGT